MRNILIFVVTLLAMIMPNVALSQECGELCDRNWWETASEAEVKTSIKKANVDARTEFGYTSLYFATLQGTPDNITALIKAGASVDARTVYGWTPLYYAALRRTPEIIMVLIKAGADVNARDESSNTPLHNAALSKTPKNIIVLLDAGADGSLKNDDATRRLI